MQLLCNSCGLLNNCTIIVDVVSRAIVAYNALQFILQLLQAFQRDGKYSWGENVAAANIFHHVGSPAIIAQKLQRIACNKSHTKKPE